MVSSENATAFASSVSPHPGSPRKFIELDLVNDKIRESYWVTILALSTAFLCDGALQSGRSAPGGKYSRTFALGRVREVEGDQVSAGVYIRPVRVRLYGYARQSPERHKQTALSHTRVRGAEPIAFFVIFT